MKRSKMAARLLCRSIALALCTGSVAMATPALAQDRAFDLKTAELRSVLPEFGRQAGLQIVAPNEGVGHIRTKPIKGVLPPREVLAMLLDGTGISIASDDGHTIALRASLPMTASLGSVAHRGNAAAMAPVVSMAMQAAPAAVAPEPVRAPQPPRVSTLDKVEVIGTQIKRAAASENLLPSLGIRPEQIEATGAVNGDDLYRSIPQMGDVTFHSGNGTSSSNFARGDISGANLRNLGPGNTLLLINGRRTVLHPTSQGDENAVPVFAYNVNTIPVPGLARVDVLLNGASAIYGADAVAGVVNNVLRDDYDGASISMQYGFGEGTGLRDRMISGLWGHNFHDLRGNVTLAYTLQDSTGLTSHDQWWTATRDRRFDFADTRFAGYGSLNRTLGGYSRFANLTALQTGAVTQNGTALTTSAGFFHTQPTTNAGCIVQLTAGTCIDDGSQDVAGADANLRWDSQKEFPSSFDPEFNRVNLFATSKYDFDNGIGLFSELGYYRSRSHMWQPTASSISAQVAIVAASNYWNPFGAVYLPDGSLNPNRLPGLNVPAEGINVAIRGIKMERPTIVDVDHKQYRALVGLRGLHFGFDWETALLYSQATATDSMNAISSTALERSMALSTPAAYNPFATSINSDAVIDSVTFNAVRATKSTLALWDFKASRPDLFSIPAGDIGIATGVEVRRETQLDDRDPRVDGTITWNSISGVAYPGDMFGVSPTPDTYGKRTVSGIYAELYLPLVSPDWNIPLVRRFDVQIAGRAEHYSDFGNVSKPKVAFGWDIFDGLSVRGSWSKAFRAPNLEQMNAAMIVRTNGRIDPLLCEASVRNGSLANFAACAINYGISGNRMGNPDLKPETSDNISGGIVFEPKFLPEGLGKLRMSVDYFKYEQEGIIGMYGDTNHLALDYLLRVQGSSNPAVVRAAPNADDIARFAGTGLAPTGEVLYLEEQFVNLLPQRVRGVDFAVDWQSQETAFGTFSLGVNGTRLIEFYREVSPDVQVLVDARNAGTINAATSIVGGGDLLMINGKPKWKWTGIAVWSIGNFQTGLTARYTGNYYENFLRDSIGYYEPGSSTYWNGHVKYTLGNAQGWLAGTSIKLGVNNIEDRRPPISSDTRGYLPLLYTGTPRYWYVNVTKEF